MNKTRRNVTVIVVSIMLLALAVYIICDLCIGCEKRNRNFTTGTWSAQNFNVGEFKIDDFKLTICERDENSNEKYFKSGNKILSLNVFINNEPTTLTWCLNHNRTLLYDIKWNNYPISGDAYMQKSRGKTFITIQINIEDPNAEKYVVIASTTATLTQI